MTFFLFVLALRCRFGEGALRDAGGAASEKADAHACCKKGWEAALPSCCMEVGTEGAASNVTARVVAPAPEVAMAAAGRGHPGIRTPGGSFRRPDGPRSLPTAEKHPPRLIVVPPGSPA